MSKYPTRETRRLRHPRLDRRTFLKTAGVGAAALPFVPLLNTEVLGNGLAFPKRLLVFYFSNGLFQGGFFPTGGTETDFELPFILEPLAPYKDDLLVIEGLDLQACIDGPIGGHIGGMGALLTGRPILSSGFEENGIAYGYASGPSVDQVIGAEFQSITPFPTVDTGVWIDKYGSNMGLTQRRMCYRAANEPVHPEENPTALWDRLFAEASLGFEELEALRARQMKVLDHLSGELTGLHGRLPTEDRVKLEAHLDAVSEIEQRLSFPLHACEPMQRTHEGPNYEKIGRGLIDGIVEAFACDLTRVASIQWNAEGRAIGPFAWLGHDDQEHSYSHAGTSEGTKIARFHETRRWYMEQVRYLLDRLREIPEGDGTLLDNCVVLVCSPLGNSSTHKVNNAPFLLAGSAGGFFATGRHVKVQPRPHNPLLTTLCHAMGLDAPWFGDSIYGTGPMHELLA
jgi:hypothetical protein